jgi:hypothetical protein
MQYAHTDFLSYEEIDTEVCRIFKAYCDAALMEAAKANPSGTVGYWSKVLEFRHAHLSPFDRPDMVRKAGKEPTKLSDKALNEAKSGIEGKFAYALAFLYWFDARADYWSRHEVDQKLLKTTVSSAELATLFKSARDVQARIKDAEQIPGAVKWGYWNNGNNGNDGRGGLARSDRPERP